MSPVHYKYNIVASSKEYHYFMFTPSSFFLIVRKHEITQALEHQIIWEHQFQWNNLRSRRQARAFKSEEAANVSATHRINDDKRSHDRGRRKWWRQDHHLRLRICEFEKFDSMSSLIQAILCLRSELCKSHKKKLGTNMPWTTRMISFLYGKLHEILQTSLVPKCPQRQRPCIFIWKSPQV